MVHSYVWVISLVCDKLRASVGSDMTRYAMLSEDM